MALFSAPLNPATVYLLVGFDKVILKSDDAGDNWTNITPGFPDGTGVVYPGYNWSGERYGCFNNSVCKR